MENLKNVVMVFGPTAGRWPLLLGAAHETRKTLLENGYNLIAVGGDSGGALVASLIAADVDPNQWLKDHSHRLATAKIGGSFIGWINSLYNFFKYGGFLNANRLYEEIGKVAVEPHPPKIPCYAYAWSLSSEREVVFPLHKMAEHPETKDSWGMPIFASMALPGALSCMVVPHTKILDKEFLGLNIPEEYRYEGVSCFGDGGTSSYLPIDMMLNVGELLSEGTEDRWVQTELEDMETVHSTPVTVAIVLDDPRPPYDPNFVKRPAIDKFFKSCWGALRANANEDREDMAGNPCFTMWAPTPDRHQKWLLRFDAPLDQLQDMFEAGREAARSNVGEMLTHLSHHMADCD